VFLPLNELINRAARIIRQARYTVVLTGAGISTESGIPDFRSPGTGLWEKEDPEDFTIESFNRDPQAFYLRMLPLLRIINDASPNRGHKAIAAMEARGVVQTVITQNVDNLHQEAGSRNVLEVHGSLKTGTCLSCGQKNTLHDIVFFLERGDNLTCSHCSGMLKPDVTLFGEDMPPAFDKAHKEAMRCDCMLVVGSSLQVAPVGYLPRYSKNLLILNRGTTPYDEMARVVIRSPAGEVLDGILEAIDDVYI
jgi:NAD-dependent deacetylase